MITKEVYGNMFASDRDAARDYFKGLRDAVKTLEDIQSADRWADKTPEDTINTFVAAVGLDVANIVIATLVNRSAWDGRISKAAADWAKSIENALDEDAAVDAWMSTNMHTAHLDQVARAMMNYKPVPADEYKPAEYEFINVDGQPAVKIAGAVYNLRKSAYAVNLSPVIVSDHMTGKMLGIPSISTSVLKNPICQERRKVAGSICEKCFAANVLTRSSDCEKNAASNFELLNSCVLPFELLPKFGNVCIARIESFGDVASVIQAINYANMAYNNPLVTFGWWTKNVEIVAKAFDIVGKPDNVIFIQSSRFVNKPEEKRSEYVDKVFTVYDDEYLKNVAEIADTYNIILSKYAGKLSKSKECKAAIAALFEDKFINCGGRDCVSCRSCYSHNDVVDVRERLK